MIAAGTTAPDPGDSYRLREKGKSGLTPQPNGAAHPVPA
jgi:hypothetical protein